MDWSLVIERLRAISNDYARKAIGTYTDAAERHKVMSDVFAGLAAALDAGMSVHQLEK